MMAHWGLKMSLAMQRLIGRLLTLTYFIILLWLAVLIWNALSSPCLYCWCKVSCFRIGNNLCRISSSILSLTLSNVLYIIYAALSVTCLWETSEFSVALYCLSVPGSIPGGVTWDFFRGSFRQNHVPWGRLSLWKWVPGISPGVKAAGAFGWRPTTLVVPKVEKIWGLNLPGTPRATSACRGTPLLYCLYHTFAPSRSSYC